MQLQLTQIMVVPVRIDPRTTAWENRDGGGELLRSAA